MTDSTERRQMRRAPEGVGNQVRSERRITRRVARRRQARRRVVLLVSGLVVIAVVVALLLIFLGSPGGGSSAETTRTTQAAAEDDGSAASPSTVVLALRQTGTIPVLVLLHPLSSAGVAMGMLGATLVKTSQGFKTLAELENGGQGDSVVASSLSDLLGLKVEGVTVIEWQVLLQALNRLGATGAWPQTLGGTSSATTQATDAVMALAAKAGSADWQAAVGAMALKGDGTGLRLTLKAAAAAGWSKTSMPGRAVEGVDFSYFEPDAAVAKTLLGGRSSGAAVTLEIQNGSGLAGGAEQAAGVLKPLGYTLLAFRNADDFPDVETTRIIASSDTAGEATRLQTLLGVGKVEVDAGQAAGHVVVIIGKDFTPPASTTTTQSAQ